VTPYHEDLAPLTPRHEILLHWLVGMEKMNSKILLFGVGLIGQCCCNMYREALCFNLKSTEMLIIVLCCCGDVQVLCIFMSQLWPMLVMSWTLLGDMHAVTQILLFSKHF